jgi:hypothetical protein
VTKREARPLCHGFLRHAAEADSPGAAVPQPAAEKPTPEAGKTGHTLGSANADCELGPLLRW